MNDLVLIVELTSFEGDTVWNETIPDPFFVIADCETGEIMDWGYRSYEHALRYYPNAINKSAPTRT